MTFVSAVVLVYHPSCATAGVSKHVVFARWRTTSFYSYGSGSYGSKILAKVDKSRWPDCLTCAFTRPDSARLLPVGLHEELGFETPVDSEGDLQARLMAAANFGLQAIVREHGT